MKRITALILLCVLLLTSGAVCCHGVGVSAQSALLMDAESGRVIYEKNAHQRLGMASTTKIMTALTAIEGGELDKTVEISPEAVGVEGSSIYLGYGERLTMKELIYALLLQSANDAATAIAIEIGGSVDGFAELMNKKAEEMGLRDTHFTNPHGLYDENHYTTAYELAVMTRYALQNPTFKEAVATVKTMIPLKNGEGTRVLVNHNKLLRTYDGAIGVKTGFTKRTGRCLVSAAERDGTTVIAVTLNAPNDWNDHRALLDLGFEKIKTLTLAEPESVRFKVAVVGGRDGYVTVTNREGLKYTCDRATADVTCETVLDRFLFAPVTEGQTVGRVIYYDNGQPIGEVRLVTENAVDKKTIKKKLFGLF